MKQSMWMIKFIICLAFADFTVFGLDSERSDCLVHIVASWAMIAVCVGLIFFLQYHHKSEKE